MCATTARRPLFDGSLVRDGAVVIAVGSHEPEAREVDSALVARSVVVVESRASALREAGDVLGAIADGAVPADGGIAGDLADLVAGRVPLDGRPRLFKSVGEAWEDLVVADLAVQRIGARA